MSPPRPPIQTARYVVGQAPVQTRSNPRLRALPPPTSRLSQVPYREDKWGFGSALGNDTDRLAVQVDPVAAAPATKVGICALVGFGVGKILFG